MLPAMLTDTHCHLSDPALAGELPAVLTRARAAGVTRCVAIATDPADAQQVLEIAGRHREVWAAVGIHPNHVGEARLCEMQQIAQRAGHPRVVAIGETGLDFFRDARNNPKLQQQQKDFLWAHLDLARQHRLPVVIHNRSADADLLEIFRAHQPGFRPWGVMHCFAGNQAFAEACLELGLWLSFTGLVTFKKNDAVRDLIRQMPLDCLMLETDAPYLAPEPYRGQRNEPAHLPRVAGVVAEVKGLLVEEVARITSANAQRFFRLPPATD